MNIVGISEVEWFQCVDEMPLDWKRSINAWVAVRRAILQAIANAKFFLKVGDIKMATHYLHEAWRIQDRNIKSKTTIYI